MLHLEHNLDTWGSRSEIPGKFWVWGRMVKMGWTDCVRNEEVLRTGGEEYRAYNKKKVGRRIGLETACIGTVF